MGTRGDPSLWCSARGGPQQRDQPGDPSDAHRAARAAEPARPKPRHGLIPVIVPPSRRSGGHESADQPAALDGGAGAPGLAVDDAGAGDDLGDRHQDERGPPRGTASDVVREAEVPDRPPHRRGPPTARTRPARRYRRPTAPPRRTPAFAIAVAPVRVTSVASPASGRALAPATRTADLEHQVVAGRRDRRSSSEVAIHTVITTGNSSAALVTLRPRICSAPDRRVRGSGRIRWSS